MALINNIETSQAPYFGLNALHHQHEEVQNDVVSMIRQEPDQIGPNTVEPSPATQIEKSPYENDLRPGDQFRLAQQLSYDLSSDFKDFPARQEGIVEEGRIGDADLVEYFDNQQDQVDPNQR